MHTLSAREAPHCSLTLTIIASLVKDAKEARTTARLGLGLGGLGLGGLGLASRLAVGLEFSLALGIALGITLGIALGLRG